MYADVWRRAAGSLARADLKSTIFARFFANLGIRAIFPDFCKWPSTFFDSHRFAIARCVFCSLCQIFATPLPAVRPSTRGTFWALFDFFDANFCLVCPNCRKKIYEPVTFCCFKRCAIPKCTCGYLDRGVRALHGGAPARASSAVYARFSRFEPATVVKWFLKREQFFESATHFCYILIGPEVWPVF